MLRFPRFSSYRATGAILTGLIVAVFLVSCSGGNAERTDPNSNDSVSPDARLEAPKSRWDLARNTAIIGQAAATIIAIGLGGAFAWRRGYLFRAGQPYVTISHEINHRRVSPEYVHLEITATLRNPSRVKVEFRDALFIVQQLTPADDDYVFTLYRKAFPDTDPRKYQPLDWEYLEEIRREWNKDELIVEPGASAPVTFEYVLGTGIPSVSITTQFYNLRVTGKIHDDINPRNAENRKWFGLWAVSGTKGWNRTTTYDII